MIASIMASASGSPKRTARIAEVSITILGRMAEFVVTDDSVRGSGVPIGHGGHEFFI